jgi:hypothetical protein
MTTGNSSPFALCSVISHTRAFLFVHVRQQRQPIDEAEERRLRLAALVLARGRDELGEVLDAALGVLASLVAQVLQVAALVEHLADGDRDRFGPRHVGELHDQIAKGGQRGGGAIRERTILEPAHDSRPERVRRRRRPQAGEKGQLALRRARGERIAGALVLSLSKDERVK